VKIKKIIITALMGVILSFAAFGTTAFAAEGDIDPNAFTPGGSGTVIDNVTEQNGKEFYTIQTDDGNIFYLIVDRLRTSDNVYFLNAVTESDLMALAAKGGKTITPGTPIDEEKTGESEQPKQPEEKTPSASSGLDGNTTTIIFVGIAVVVVGGIGFYLKIVRPKKRGKQNDDDEFDDEYEDSDDEEDVTEDEDS
jgi:hypothetical protein